MAHNKSVLPIKAKNVSCGIDKSTYNLLTDMLKKVKKREENLKNIYNTVQHSHGYKRIKKCPSEHSLLRVLELF